MQAPAALLTMVRVVVHIPVLVVRVMPDLVGRNIQVPVARLIMALAVQDTQVQAVLHTTVLVVLLMMVREVDAIRGRVVHVIPVLVERALIAQAFVARKKSHIKRVNQYRQKRRLFLAMHLPDCYAKR